MVSFPSKEILGRTCIFIFGMIPLTAFSAPLTLTDYLSKVKTSHLGYQGSQNVSEGAKIRSQEGELLLAPSLFVNAQKSSDAKPTANPSFQGTKTLFDSYSLGVSKLTSFGLTAKLSYNVNYTSLEGVTPTFVPVPQFYDAKPMLELNQSLWRNGFGRETSTTLELQEAQANATSFGESYKAKLILLESEMTYWRLVLARESVFVQKESLERFKKIENWIAGRVRQDLNDKSDLYQATAASQGKELELQAARDEERSASRAFNSLLGQEAEAVEVELSRLEPGTLEKVDVPKRGKFRDDVKAAEEGQKAAILAGKLNMEKSYPTLDLFGALAYNGRSESFGTATSDSVKTERPTWMAGVKFSTGLDIGLASDIRDGIRKEQLGAELNYKRKLFEQEREWVDLNQKFEDAKKRLDLAFAIEKSQEKKLTYEKVRHQRARSTTYQVLLFEQDFANAQLSRIRAQADLLKLIAQMKTFGEKI